MKTTQLSHNIPRPGRHTALSSIVFLLTTLCSIPILFPSLSFSSVTTTYEYNVLDRVGVVGYGSSLTETYTYDANGNRVSVAVSTGEGGMMGMAMKTTTLQEPTSAKAAASSPSGTLTTTASLIPSASTVSSGSSSVTEVSRSTATRETATVPPAQDIIWRDTTTGQYAIWRMEGVTYGNSLSLSYGYDASGNVTSITDTIVTKTKAA